MSRVACPNVENSENQADQVWAFSPSFGGFGGVDKAEMAKILKNDLNEPPQP